MRRERPNLLRLPVSFTAAALLLGAASAAFAQEETSPAPVSSAPSSARAWELGGRVSYVAPPISGGTNPLGAGFGARLGASVAQVYLGVGMVGYLGSTDVDLTSRALLYGGELGYNLPIATGTDNVFTLRPQVGFGGLSLFYTTTTPTASSGTGTNTRRTVRARDVGVDVLSGASSSSSSSGRSSGSTSDTTTVSSFYFQPGVTLMFSSASTFAGVNGSVLVVPSLAYGGNDPVTWVTYGVEGQLGLRF